MMVVRLVELWAEQWVAWKAVQKVRCLVVLMAVQWVRKLVACWADSWAVHLAARSVRLLAPGTGRMRVVHWADAKGVCLVGWWGEHSAASTAAQKDEQ